MHFSLRKLIRIYAAGTLYVVGALWAWEAQACQIDVGGTTFTVSPSEEQSTARANVVECQLGELRYYDPNEGWLSMVDESGQSMMVQDIKGLSSAWGPFLVAVLSDYRVAMRYGPPSAQFFLKDQSHSAFYATNQQGNSIYAFSIIEVSTTPRGEIVVELEAESEQICSIKSDAGGMFHWNWECRLNPNAN